MSTSRGLMESFKSKWQAANEASKRTAQLWASIDAEEMLRDLEEEQAAIRREREELHQQREATKAERKAEMEAWEQERQEWAAERQRLRRRLEELDAELHGRIERRDADIRKLVNQVQGLQVEQKNFEQANVQLKHVNSSLEDRCAQLEAELTKQTIIEKELRSNLSELDVQFKEERCRHEIHLERLQAEHTEQMEDAQRTFKAAQRASAEQVETLLGYQQKYAEMRRKLALVQGLTKASNQPVRPLTTTSNLPGRFLRDVGGSSVGSVDEDPKRPRRRTSSSLSHDRPHTAR